MLMGLLKKTTEQIFTKFYGIVGHNLEGPIDSILSDLDPGSRSLEVKGQTCFAINSVQNCREKN